MGAGRAIERRMNLAGAGSSSAAQAVPAGDRTTVALTGLVLEERAGVPGIVDGQLPPPAAHRAHRRHGVVEDHGLSGDPSLLGELGELLSGDAGDALAVTVEHRRMVDQLDAQLRLQPFHLAYQGIDGAPGGAGRAFIDRHEHELVISQITGSGERSVVGGPLRDKAVNNREHALALTRVELTLGGENP